MVTDDWRYRMLTPPKGNADYIQVNAEARKVMDGWDPAKDEASGEPVAGTAPAEIMRLPSRLHITWDDDNTMKMDIDAGHPDAALRVRRGTCGGRALMAGLLVGAMDVSSGRSWSWSGAAADGSACRNDDSHASRICAQERHPVQRERHVHRYFVVSSTTTARSTWR